MLAEAGRQVSWELPGDVDRLDFVAAVRRHRVVEILADNLGRGISLPKEVAEVLVEERRANAVQIMRLVHDLGRASALLRDSEIDHLVFKGPVLAAITTGDFTARGPSDLDFWVPPHLLSNAHAVLAEAGWEPRRSYPVPGPSWAWRHLVRTTNELPMTAQHHELDLHWRLHPAWCAAPRFDEAWAVRQTVQLGDMTVETLGFAEQLRHSCSHAARDEYRWLRSLVDLHRLVRDPEMWKAHGGALSSIEGEALVVVQASVGLPDSAPVLPLTVPHGAERVISRGFQAQEGAVPSVGGGTPGGQLPGAVRRYLRESATPRDALGVVSGLVLPPAELGGLSHRRAAAAIPRAVVRRVAYIARRVRGWRATKQAQAHQCRCGL